MLAAAAAAPGAVMVACPGLSRLNWSQECAEMVPCEEARTEAVWSVVYINLGLIFRRRGLTSHTQCLELLGEEAVT